LYDLEDVNWVMSEDIQDV